MRDSEIIKALECCARLRVAVCNNLCPMFYNGTGSRNACMRELHIYALDLLNRQKAEIERLKKETEEYPFKCKVGNNSEIHSKSIEDYDNLIGDISAEAIKEFSKRLKDVWFDNRYDSPSIDFDYFVDNLVEEMTEVTENDL